MFKAPITPIQNSKFKIQNSSQRRFSEGSAKDERRMGEGKSASWRSRVCEASAARTEGKSASWHSRVCEANAARTFFKALPH